LKATGDASLLGCRDAVALSAAVRAGDISALEVAEAFLLACGDDEIGAWSAVDPYVLLDRAAELDGMSEAERDLMPLFGVPCGVKDNFDTAGLVTAYGSPIYAHHRPRRDAEAVRRLTGGGAIVSGKTKCSEFAWMSAPDTLNPLDRARTPGGSSSGSAAAVASGTVPIATGTQTAGSVIRPASYCGVIGYKPTFEVFPREGVKVLSPTLDTVGVFARSIRDIRLAASSLERRLDGLRRRPADELSRTPRLALARTPAWNEVQPDARVAIENVALAAWDAGASLEDVDLPRGFDRLVAAQEVIQAVESAGSLSCELRTHGALMSEALRAALRRGLVIAPSAYAAARRTAAQLGPKVAAVLAGYDGVLTPSTTGTPPLGLEFTGDPQFCRAWTLIGAPCVAVPLAWTPSRLPVGIQVVGAPLSDGRTLATAEWLLDRLAPLAGSRT
jgi:Asp-tRNA(Asn)/Glu-tRNA(Gln) amidotransferase A subunit family amidase